MAGSKEVLFRRTGIPVAIALAGHLLLSSLACRAQDIASSTYITPFPPQDRYQVRVVADWFGTGLAGGLQDAFKQDGSVQVTDASKSSYGLTKAVQVELYADVERIASSGATQIVVVMMGANDRQYIRTAAGLAAPGSTEWKDAYGKEADKLIKKLKAGNTAVYWVGMPIMSSPAFSDLVTGINDTIRQVCYLNGAKFIDTWNGFTDQRGGYSAYGPDLTGQTKRLREADGVALTALGSRKLASYVEIILRRDLTQAKAQRNIPLAGDQEEQARVVPPTYVAAPSDDPNGGSENRAASSSVGQNENAGASSDAPSFQQTASEFARRDSAAYASSLQMGELILGGSENGLTSIAVISPAGDFTPRDIQRETPLAERLYYKVLSKGEALPPKEGRADDFRWPAGPSKSQ